MGNIILQLIAEIASNITKAVYMIDISDNKLALVVTMQKCKM